MRLKDDQIGRLADRILANLREGNQIDLKQERSAVVAAIRATISADIRQEEELERDAERLLEQTLRVSDSGAGIDRRKMLRMIKEKLAKDRKIVL